MDISCVNRWVPSYIYETIEQNGLLIATAAVVSIVAYVMWGQLGLITTAASMFMFYSFFGPVIRILNYFDLRGIILAISAFVLPYFGGIAAIVGSAYLGVCLLSYEWQQAAIRIDLEEQTQGLQDRNTQLQGQVQQFQQRTQELGNLLTQASARNDELQQATDTVQAEAADFNQIFQQLTAFLQDSNNQQQLAAQQQLQAEIMEQQQELQQLTTQVKIATEESSKWKTKIEQALQALQLDTTTRQRITAQLLAMLPSS